MLSPRVQEIMQELGNELAKDKCALWGFVVKDDGNGETFSCPPLDEDSIVDATVIALENMTGKTWKATVNADSFDEPKSTRLILPN